jgi:AraC-like DNA-binding protein
LNEEQWIVIAGYTHILAGVQGLFLVILLNGFTAENRKPNRILSLLMLAISLIVLGTGLGATGLYNTAPHLIRTGAPFVLVIGPLVLFYITALRIGKVPSIQWLHLIPFLVYLLWLMPFYFSGADQKITWVEDSLKLSQSESWVNLAKVTHLFGYIVWIQYLLGLHKKNVQNFAADLKETELGWIRNLNATLLILGVLSIITYGISAFGFIDTILVNYFLGFVVSVILYLLGYISLTKPQLFGDRDYPSWRYNNLWSLLWGKLYFDTATEPDEDQIHKESRLLEQLKMFMDEERPYRNSELTLAALSHETNIPQYLLSRIINRHLNQNFFDFVNEYRVREVKEKLIDPNSSGLTIYALALEAGFNSKSSFYTAFRKSTGHTPSEYRKKYTGK